MAEESRTHHYLLSATDPPLQQILDDRLLTPNLTAVLSMRSSGLDAMIDTDKVEVLALLYKLFNRVPTGLGTLKKALKDSVIERGKEINQTAAGDGEGEDVEEPEEPPQGKGKGKAQAGAARQIVTVALKWVQDILDLKDKFDAVLRRAFQDDMQIQTALNEVRYLFREYWHYPAITAKHPLGI